MWTSVGQTRAYLQEVREFLKKHRSFAKKYVRGLQGLDLDAWMAELDALDALQEQAKKVKQPLAEQIDALMSQAERVAASVRRIAEGHALLGGETIEAPPVPKQRGFANRLAYLKIVRAFAEKHRGVFGVQRKKLAELIGRIEPLSLKHEDAKQASKPITSELYQKVQSAVSKAAAWVELYRVLARITGQREVLQEAPIQPRARKRRAAAVVTPAPVTEAAAKPAA